MVDAKPKYSIKTGVLKAVKNMVVVLWPFILGGITTMPPEWQVQYAPIISFVSYLVKNYLENR